MADDPRYLRICNWENYQIYHDGRPMKFFAVQAVDDEKRGRRGILTNPAFLRLADRSDCPVFQLMALAARDNNRIPNDAKYLQGVLACTNEPNIAEMLDAGFLEVYSEDLAQQSHRTENGVSRTENGDSPSIEKAERTETTEKEVQAIYEHWRDVRGKTHGRYLRMSDARRQKIRSRLREFSADELKQALDAVALDPWEERSRHDDLTTLFRSQEQVEKFLALAENPPARRVSAADIRNMDFA